MPQIYHDGRYMGNATPGHKIYDENGVAMTDRAKLEFTGEGVEVTDDAANGKTVVSITGGGGSACDELIRDTVGWTGKNLLKNTASSQTINGVTFTVNADKSVTVNGTATGNAIFYISNRSEDIVFDSPVIFSGSPSQSADNTVYMRVDRYNGSTYVDGISCYGGNEVLLSDLTKKYRDFRITVLSGQTVFNLTFYPMIRHADITDSAYEPYHESVEEEIEQIYAGNGVLGAKNLLKNIATSQTINGVTVTVDDDKVITLNGTSTADSYISIFAVSDLNGVLAKYGDLILNGSHPTEYTKARLITRYGTSNYVYVVDSGKGVLLSPTVTYQMGITLQIFKNNTFTNHKVYPMLRLASDPDSTYRLYAMTNRELTEKVFEKRTLTSTDDLNDIKETGIYGITTQPLNSPIAYATLIVCKRSDGGISQLLQKVNELYSRSYGGSPSSWQPWYKFTGTEVS